jgi:hypothetical protein
VGIYELKNVWKNVARYEEMSGVKCVEMSGVKCVGRYVGRYVGILSVFFLISNIGLLSPF